MVLTNQGGVAQGIHTEDTVADLSKDADETVCLRCPPNFAAVGQFYRVFPQTEDEEVLAIMREEAQRKVTSKS